MKKVFIYFITLVLSLSVLTACKENSRPSLDKRINDVGPVKITSYEGKIKALENLDLYQQGTHKLITEDGEIVIIQSPSMDLSQYLNENVLVKGDIEQGVGNSKDVFTVNKITYVDESKVKKLVEYENKLYGFKFKHPNNWIIDEGQESLGLKFQEKEIMSITVFSDKTDLYDFVSKREEEDGVEVTIASQKALRYMYSSQMGFYLQNPPKKKIYFIKFTPSINSADNEKGFNTQRNTFYDILDSFELIYLKQYHGEKCGGLKQIKCEEGYLCQLDSDGKYAEGTCKSIEDTGQMSCPYIAPPTNCKQYRISEYSQKGCPSRYECLEEANDIDSPQPSSFRDLDVLNNNETVSNKEEINAETLESNEEELKLEEEIIEETSESNIPEQEGVVNEGKNENQNSEDDKKVGHEYKIPDLTDLTATYTNNRQNFIMIMPKTWYYASFGPIDGSLWKVGFSDVEFETPEEAVIMLSVLKESNSSASKQLGSLYYNLNGPDDLGAIMKKMAETIESF